MLSTVTSRILHNFANNAKIARVTLPDLKFNYTALEPVLSSKLLEIHHKKHHQAYVNNLNAALDQFEGSYLLTQRPKQILITIKWLY